MQSKIKYPLSIYLLFSFITCACFFYSNTAQAQSDPEVKAKQLFESGRYAEALPVFEDLTRLYPADPELNYYSGASLIETGQFTPAALKALMLAGNYEKSYWYLAQYYHANNQWEKAMEAYQEFKDNATAKEINSVSLDEMTALCAQEINPYQLVNGDMEPNANTQDGIHKTEQNKVASENIVFHEPKAPVTKERYADSIISFPVNAQVTYLKISQFKSEKAKQDFLHARSLEQKLNKQLQTNKTLRGRYDAVDEMMKMQLADSILLLEQESYRLNQEIAQKDQNANQLEAAYWSSASLSEISQFRATIQHLRDSIAVAREQKQIQAMQQAEIIVVEANDSLAIDTLQADEKPMDQILYRIQIGAYRHNPPDWVQQLFKKLSVLRRIDQYTDENGVTVYTVGELRSYEDAQQMLKQIKLEGVSNATIAAYRNNERIPVPEAKKLQQNGS